MLLIAVCIEVSMVDDGILVFYLQKKRVIKEVNLRWND
jgi:hypothetical protein